jgi:hypothetical protein
MAVNNLNTPGVGIQPSIVDAKGDLIAATANDAVNRLAVGTNGQVLVADSGETTGLKWNNPGTVGGLVHINTTSFTSVADQTVNSVFTSTYTNYFLILNFTAAANSHISTIQFTASATPTTTNYKSRYNRWYAASLAVDRLDDDPGTDEIPICIVSTTNPTWSSRTINIYGPQAARATVVESTGAGGFGVSNFYWESTTGLQNSSTQFDGFKLIFNGNTSGTVSVYGVRK